jgi:hypothetical protein
VTLPIAIRGYDRTTDEAFVYKAWITSYRSSDRAGVIPDHVFYSLTKITINQLLARGMKIAMAVSPDDRDQILGFIAWEHPGPILHYCFVKHFVRQRGVATLLKAYANFASAPLFATFWTEDARHLGQVIHRPGFARRKHPYDPAIDGALRG